MTKENEVGSATVEDATVERIKTMIKSMRDNLRWDWDEKTLNAVLEKIEYIMG